MFSYNAGNRPESKTMRMFRPVRQVAALGRSLSLPTAFYMFVISTFKKN